MKTKTILQTLALAMLMPAMLLTTACSNSDDEIVNTENPTNTKGYALPVTINVTRQGDAATTRASYNETSKKLSFSTGDKLFVSGSYNEGDYTYAGILGYVSDGTFSGTIITQTEWTGTTEELLSADGGANATLLPAGYGEYGYLSIADEGTYEAILSENYNKAFATSKATAVEQFSYEYDNDYSSGFELIPVNAILNFTINGLDASTEVDVSFSYPNYPEGIVVSGKVTTDGDGTATFAIGIIYGNNLKDCTLTVGGNAITLPADKEVEAGKIYNISRSVAVVVPSFTINAGGTKVHFAQGNLQATTTDGSTWTWAFAEHQWDYIGNAAANTSINGDGTVSGTGTRTVDLFGWVGASNTTWTGAAMYGLTNSTTTDSASGYGNSTSDALKSDWGNTISDGYTWRTLTKDEWTYVFNTRTTGGTVFGTAQARYAHATINTDGTGVNGMILFPDGVDIASTEVTTAGSVNATSEYATKCTSAQWTALAAKGCVFLPAAGRRDGSSVYSADSYGYYWSSSPYTSSADYAYSVYFKSDRLNPASGSSRGYGRSVRLVRQVE